MLISKGSRAKERKTAAVSLSFSSPTVSIFKWFMILTTEVVIIDVDLRATVFHYLSPGRRKMLSLSWIYRFGWKVFPQGNCSSSLCLSPGLSCLPKECAYGPIFLLMFLRYSHSSTSFSSDLHPICSISISIFLTSCSFLSCLTVNPLFLSLSLRTCLWICLPPFHSLESLCLRIFASHVLSFCRFLIPMHSVSLRYSRHMVLSSEDSTLFFFSQSHVAEKSQGERHPVLFLSISLTMCPILPSVWERKRL